MRRAEAGEQVEVCAGSSVRTEIRVYDGDVESLTVAESRGVGVRVIRDGREGLAHAGSWDSDVIDTLLAEARDNMSFAEPDDRVGLAEPDGVGATDIDPWDDRIEATSVDDKVAIAVAPKRPPGRRSSGSRRPHLDVRRLRGERHRLLGRDRRLGSRASASIGTQPLIDDRQLHSHRLYRRRRGAPVARHRGGRPTRSGARCSSSAPDPHHRSTTGGTEPRFTARSSASSPACSRASWW